MICVCKNDNPLSSLALALSLSISLPMACVSHAHGLHETIMLQVLVYIIFCMKSFASHLHVDTSVSAECVSRQIVTELQ